MTNAYFITGALGCIGAWVVKSLLDRGDTPVVFDLGNDARRIRDIVEDAALTRVRFLEGDITDRSRIVQAMKESGATRVIHLAGLQVPFCKRDPALGARVNVLGTIHMFEAAKELGIGHIAYASSAAVYGKDDGDCPSEADIPHPLTHYGVFKCANEGTARIFWNDSGVSSVGLRPLTVYGVGRDQGLTSGPTSAIKAAVVGEPYEIAFTGVTDFLYAADIAQAFIHAADRAGGAADVYNVHGDTIDVADFVSMIGAGGITCAGDTLPVPPAVDGSALRSAWPDLPHTTPEAGIDATMQRFRGLLQSGRLDLRDLRS